MKTKVKFYHEGGGILAVFPEERFGIGNAFQNCYSHVGQHGGCNPAYIAELKPATPEEYKDLKTELESIGYKLEIL